MRNTSSHQGRQEVHLKKINDFLFTALLYAIFILVLFYFFDRGAELVAEVIGDSRIFPFMWYARE